MEKLIIPIQSTNDVSDGYHTFSELYEHRIVLFIVLCKQLVEQIKEERGDVSVIWRSQKHSNGEVIFPDEHGYAGWFVLGIGKEKGEQITYHLPISKWEKTNFAETLEKAPEFDGHTSQDVLQRIQEL